MSQATIAARPAHEHRALLSRSDPQAAQPAHRDRRADRGAAARRQALHRRALFGRRRPARGARRRARSWSAPARSTRRSCSSCPASASPSGCASSASRCARRCPASARTCATITRRARAGAVGAEGHHLQRPRARPRHGLSGDALRAVPQRPAAQGRRADARLRLLARGARGAGPAARLGADADRARPQGPADRRASPASPATPIRCGPRARAASTSPRPIRAGRPRSTSTSCRRRSMRS